MARLILPDYYTGAFPCIEIDWPWKYDDCGYNGWADVQEYRIHPPYEQMPIEHIFEDMEQVNRVAEPLAHLWTWVTKDFLGDAFVMLEAHGWAYKQIVPWIKVRKDGQPSYGMGHWMRNAVEFLLLHTRRPASSRGNYKGKYLGLLPKRTTTPNYLLNPEIYEGNWNLFADNDFVDPQGETIFSPKGRHSEKPDCAYEMIASLSPGPRLSIFQRKQREHFVCFGNEMPLAT